MTLADYQSQVKKLSDRLIDLQRPIRILDAIKWPATVKAEFLAKGGKELPAIDQHYYQQISLGFEPELLSSRFKELKLEVQRCLGRGDGLGSILVATIDQYLLVIELLKSRGTV
ncbi:MAG: DUF1704 domain-containing protein, partial [Gammaproteobacteria bacterium]|nr:DUF1704 domain-containing protein [Gammaproteobacteria bacterium]